VTAHRVTAAASDPVGVGLTYRRASEADVDRLLALEADVGEPKLYGPITSQAAALKEIRDNVLYFLILGQTVVGTAAYRIGEDGSSIHISNVAVAPAYRRRGIARAAMTLIMDQNKGARRLDLVTHPENEKALDLYFSLGFRIESRRENHFGDGEPRLVLTKM
jgi:ribosomal protein S18 acetylase RimI-like enzyme